MSGLDIVMIQIKDTTAGTWFDGHSWVAQETWLDASGLDEWSYVTGFEPFLDGHSYVIQSLAYDIAGNLQTLESEAGFTFDTSGPDAGVVAHGSFAEPQHWTADTSTVSAVWTGFSDQGAGIVSYDISVGTSPEMQDIYEWSTVGLDTHAVIDSLSLGHGTTYYTRVRAWDNLGNVSEPGVTDFRTVDMVAPVVDSLFEVSTENPDFYGNSENLMVSWVGSDDLSGVESFSVAIGTAPGSDDAVGWVDSLLVDTIYFSGLSLSDGVTYYASVLAVDSAGNSSMLMGDGVTIDVSSPAVGWVYDVNSLIQDTAQVFTPSFSALTSLWSGFSDSISGISHYEYSVSVNSFQQGPVEWISVGMDTFVTDSSLTLSHGEPYYTFLRAVDGVGNASPILISSGIIADHMGPEGTMAFDGDSTELDRQNSTTTYQGHWEWFTDEHSGLDYHEVALFDVTDSLYTVEWALSDSDTVVSMDGITLLEDHFYALHVRGVDLVGNTGPITSSNGILIDLTSPAVPADLVGRFSTERIELTWSAVVEEDFSHYVVYGGLDSAGAVSIIETGQTIAEAFMPEYEDGTDYYFTLTSVDGSGNESVQSSAIHGIPRRVVITDIDPDTSTILFDTTRVIRLKLSQPVTDPGVVQLSSLVYPSMNLESTYSDSDTTLTVTIIDPYASMDTLELFIPELIDWAGDTMVHSPFYYYTNLLGDFNGDFRIGVFDLGVFIDSWNIQDISKELGPVLGTVPHVIPDYDGRLDMRDIMTLKRMWDWFNVTAPVMMAYEDYIGPSLELEQAGQDLKITLPEDVVASEIVIYYPDNVKRVVSSLSEDASSDQIVFNKEYAEEKTFIQLNGFTGDRSYDNTREIRFRIDSEEEADIALEVGYKLMGRGNQVISKGLVGMDFTPTPMEYSLSQNYPNPFNPVTKIKYSLPESGNVNLVIYDLMGREVHRLVNTRQEAGYHSVKWDGQNAVGQNVGAGMYFYVLQSRDYQQVRKMILLK